MKNKDFKKFLGDLRKQMKAKCDMCGKRRGILAASSHLPHITYKGKMLWVNKTYTLKHMYLGMSEKNSYPGVCYKCQEWMDFLSLTHRLRANISWKIKQVKEFLLRIYFKTF